MNDSLASFSEATRAWFTGAFEAPTPAQVGAWEAISGGRDALVVAPTGSGKTLAAFLSALDLLAAAPRPDPKQRLRVLYVSPLKALAVDIERNLRAPLAGIRSASLRIGVEPPAVEVAVRTGDTPPADRRRFAKSPPDILITTPESLFLLLTSQARDTMGHIDTVILDEVHAVAGTKRGAHLALSLERLDALLDVPARRIGLSATVRPVEEIAQWLAPGRDVAIVEPVNDKVFDLKIVVPVEDLAELGSTTGEVVEASADHAEERSSIWPHVEERLLDLIRSHKSTLIFANSRRLSERLCARLNDLAGEEVVRSHHGSVAREQRILIEEELKAGRLPAVVATSSLELGIDMAAVDLVVQVEAPTSVASGLQRIGRAGHQVGAVSRGVMFPKYRGDLVDAAVVVERMKKGLIEAIAYPRNPLDVLAQHIVAMTAMDDWIVSDLAALVRRSAPFSDLPDSALVAVLDMLSGRYPSDEFAELRPRVNWDRASDRLTARPAAQRLAVTSGGTIPDRGLYGVFLAGENTSRVGELDEEMVYESRVGEVFLLGATSWLIEDITHDRVLVTPAPGQPGKMPFWHGDAPGRPYELGRARGEFVRELMSAPSDDARARLLAGGLDDFAAGNLLRYLVEQKDATGIVPDDRTIVVERFRDELGDWRICVHSTFGARVNAPWSQAIQARVRERTGMEVQTIYSDDGIVVRVTEADEASPAESVAFEPDEIEDVVVAEVGASALFAGRFRECAARALLLPRRRPGSRQPLWQQRQKSAALLQVASRYESFPIVLETYRECLQDVFDLPALIDLMGGIARREVRIVEVDTSAPSPFAGSLLFGFISAFMYEGDSPLAERRAQALSLDRALLSELLGREELRELIDDEALVTVELELQMLAEGYKARSADELHDALRRIGDLSTAEMAARVAEPRAEEWIEELHSKRRVLPVRVGGEDRWIAGEDAARVRDALGAALPVGVPAAFSEPVADPLGDLVARFARTHGPFAAEDVSMRLGLPVAVVADVLRRLEVEGRVIEGEFRPGGRSGRLEWVDVEVLRRIRRRSLASYRKEIEPAAPEALARFCSVWHGVEPGSEGRRATVHDVYAVVEQLQGVPLPASQLERHLLPARLPGYDPAVLDELCASGEIVWAGAGAVASDDGWIAFTLADAAHLLPDPLPVELSPTSERIRKALAERGALFFRALAEETGSIDDQELLLALWELVWAGHATNDTLAPLRALSGGVRRPATRRRRRGPALPARLGPPSAAGRWSLVPRREIGPTRRLHASAEQLLRRHGIVTRGALGGERLPGGFAAVYPVLKAMEDAGRCRRGYFVEGLGGAQFALVGAVDRMRSLPEGPGADAVVLPAADPANPFGAALPWPDPPSGGGHRAGRKVGATVVLTGGRLGLYLEKGGRTLVTFTTDGEALERAIAALGDAARAGLLGAVHIQRVDGGPALDSPHGEVLLGAGFRQTSTGLRLRPGGGAGA